MTEQTSIPPQLDLVERLRCVPDTLRRIVCDRSSEELKQPGRDGGNAVVELLCDLQDWEEITGERIIRILREDMPHLESYDDSLWNIEHDYASRDGHAVVEAFSISRAQNLDVLQGLTDDQWQRQAMLANHGAVTLQWLIERVAGHDTNHITDIMEALT